MASNPSIPGAGDPSQHTHTTYEFAVPFRDANRSASPARQAPSQPSISSSSSSPSASPMPSPQPAASRPGIQIPKIQPLAGASPAELAVGLEGKFVDEFGNILDWDGTVMGRVEGDLPSMVGRPVTASGEIFDSEEEVAGHVSENYSRPTLKPLGANLKTDDEGNIYDDQGNVVGKLHGSTGSNETQNQKEDQQQHPHQQHQHQHQHQNQPQQPASGQGSQPPRCSCGAPRSAPAAPRPDEMYLDVKSTFDGIQLIIKIPTVFNGGGGNAQPGASNTQTAVEKQ